MSDHELPASIPDPRVSPEYMHSGPWFPGESIHQAMGENTVHALSARMIRRSRMGMNRPVGPGRGFGHEPVDDTSQHVAQSAASIRGALRPGSNPSPELDELEPFTGPYDVEEAAHQDPHEYREPVAPRLRSRDSASDPTRRTPTTPRTRRGPGGPLRP